jgi:phosphate:Na+ symporter
VKTLLGLLAAVALLVWGTHIVRTGLLRVYGANLRRVLAASVRNRFAALAAGMGVTTLLQSSTATALIASSFVGQGLIATGPALVIVLGADVGTSVIAQLFSLDLSWLSPLLILVGVVAFLSRQNTTAGRLGRVAIGFGLIILALQLIMDTTRPLTANAGVQVLFATLSGDPLLDMLFGAVLTLVCYSSLAVVLLTAALAASSVIAPQVALALVLGANLGSGLLAVLTTLGAAPEARRIPLGNFLFKAIGCLVVVPFLGPLTAALASLDPNLQRLAVDFHLVFNAALAAVFLFATGPVARLTERLLPPRTRPEDPSTPRHLDPVALDTPSLAISGAAREAMRIADTVEIMLVGTLDVIRRKDRDLSRRLRDMDDTIDQLYTAVKLYLTQVNREALEERESRRWTDIVSFTINMEQIGDGIERILRDIDDKLIKRGASFSEAGMAEIVELHTRLLGNLRLAMSVFLNGDLKGAQALIAEKVEFREREIAFARTHLQRLAWNTPESVETSSLHLDMISEMKRINSHLCSVAYPILESAGVLERSRLREEPKPLARDTRSRLAQGAARMADTGLAQPTEPKAQP